MKTTVAVLSLVALGFMGCAHHRDYSRSHDRYYVSEEHPRDAVIVDRDGNRIYVRELDSHHHREFRNNMEPYARGKGPDAMGWNTEKYYRQRGYY
jgi:hypothetical protein